MKQLFMIGAFLLLGMLSCTKEEAVIALTQEEEAKELQVLRSEIETKAQSISCTDAGDWTFTMIGEKACGGPTNYIAYSTQLDTVAFFASINKYTEAENVFNKKWGVFSDCSLEIAPKSVSCKEGKPVFIYE